MYYINVLGKPKITMITVVLNGVKTIERTIRSVINQTYCEVEYIVIDGGSTDGTLVVINKYRDSIHKIISETDEGIASAFNKGLLIASGDIIGMINSDDWLEQNALEDVWNAYAKYPYFDAYYGNCRMIDSPEPLFKPRNGHLRLIQRMSIAHPSTFVKRTAYIRYGLFDEKYQIAMDYEWLLRAYISGALFLYMDKVLSNYTPGGISHRNYVQGHAECVKAQDKYVGQ